MILKNAETDTSRLLNPMKDTREIEVPIRSLK